ncbi:cellulase family glycosylhydrolase [Cellvibrio sp. BR]|uniref:cellulase family glycosylhydrolase n=1 Tax=Cellvibrio sp. BR TaxID=1134474 RepID=UPI0018DEE3A5|nr:cellulase family glycosylhydrolase [Cellvibrio sp. BR]
MESDAVQLAAKMKLGINVGNQMEATNCPQLELTQRETCWGHPKVSEAYIQLVKDRGFDAIRLPVSWDQYADQTTGKISDFWLNRVKEVVQYAVDNGLYVMVNIHWDGGWLERSFHEAAESETKKEAVKAKQKAYWEQIATHLREFDEHVMFASANEPDTSNDNESASVIASRVAVLDEYHQTFVDAVRSTGGKNAYRVLIIQAPKTDIDLATNNWFVMPSDTATGRQMAEVHFYPFSFTNQDADIVADWGTLQFFCYWGEGNHSETDTFRNSTREEEGFVDAKFAQMKTKFADQGIPVVLGEFAARPRSEEACSDYPKHLASRAYYAQYVTQASIENGMLPFFWDTGEVFERGTPAVNNQQVLDGLLIGSGKLNGSSSSSQSSSANSSSSSTEVSSTSSSSSSSASNSIVLDTSPSNWSVSNGVVKNDSATHIQFTLSASGQAAEIGLGAPINMNGSTVEVVLNFDQVFVTDRNNGNTQFFQFFALDGDWDDVGGQQWVCMQQSTPIIADQDQTFTCSGAFNDVADAAVFGLQFFATAGTVTIKSATITLAE